MNRSRAACVLCWIAAVGACLVLLSVRYRAAVADGIGYDLRTFFVPAAEAVAQGRSPYEVVGYVYSPLVAIVLAPFFDHPNLQQWWTLAALGACLVTLVAFMAANWRLLGSITRPIMLGFAGVTLLYSWPVTLDLWIGQTDLFVFATLMVALLFGVRSAQVATGAVLGVVAALKSWPAVTVLWAFRRGAQDRVRALLGFGAAILVMMALSLVFIGPSAIVDWVRSTMLASRQDVVLYSMWGVGRHLFGTTPNMDPLVDLPWVSTVTTVVLVVLVVGLLITSLVQPGDDQLCFWHVTACAVLLLPVAHFVYFILILPLLWLWARRLMTDDRRTIVDVMAFLVLVVWWMLTFRIIWPGDYWDTISTAGYVTIVLSTVFAIAVSVFACARIEPSAGSPVQPRGSMTSSPVEEK